MTLRKLEASFNHASMVWEFAMYQTVHLEHLEHQRIAAQGFVSREMYESLGAEQIQAIIERQLHAELNRFEDALRAYDEAYGESATQTVGRRQESR
jgi:hypothetical protein